MQRKPQNYITLTSGEKIFYNEKDIDQYLNRITVLYGAAMSGKTTLMFDILHILQRKIAIPIVFCPTTESDSNTTYRSSFPQSLIFQEVDLDKIEQIYNTQKIKAKKYKIANQLNVLRKLFDHVSTEHDQRMSSRIMSSYKKIMNKIDASNHDIATKKALTRQAKSKCDDSLRVQWKDCVRKNRHKFNGIKMREIEEIGLKYMDFNPHLLLIFDDCAAQAKAWSKSPIMKELFFNGRHTYITQIYTMQNDKSIPPFLRQNAHNSIFTDESSANAFFKTSSNGFSKDKQKFVERIVTHIFTIRNGLDTFTKLIHGSNWHQPFTVIIADQYENNRMGSSFIWEYDKKLPRKNQMMHDLANDKSYMESFH